MPRPLLLIVACLLSAAPILSAQAVGCERGNCENGQGELVFADGGRFIGTFANSQFTEGILYLPDGGKCIGHFEQGLQEGKGRRYFSNGDEYFGNFRRGEFAGTGTLTYANGNVYAGEWAASQSTGQGKMTYANGDVYEGVFASGQLNGVGTMRYQDGDRYVGQWRANQRHGSGKQVFGDGGEISGEWIDDQFQADWNGMGFVGDTSCLAVCGPGKPCPQQGPGRLAYPHGQVFLGEFKDGQPGGQGTAYYTNGSKYRGEYHDHQPHGLGIMHYQDGQVEGGIWHRGRMQHRLFTANGRPAAGITVDRDPAVKIWAVIVGAARYLHMPSLRYTDDDAYQVFAFLKSPEGGALPDRQLRLLVDEDATHRNIIMAMRETFLRADENDVVLFYFSGHGLQGAFLPVDYDGFENRLEHSEIRDALLATRAKNKLVLADACHSGSLLASRAPIHETLLKYYQALADSRGGTALLLSSKGEEYSLEDGGLRSGIFSHFLIRGMKGEADADNNRIITIDELFSYVHQQVRRYTGNIQTPTLTGDFDPDMPVGVVRN